MPGKENLLGGRKAPLGVLATGLVTAAGSGEASFELAWREKRCHREEIGAQQDGTAPPGYRVNDSILRAWKDAGSGDERATRLAGLAIDEALRAAPAPGKRLGLALGTALGSISALEARIDAESSPATAPRGDAHGPEDSPDYFFEMFSSRLARVAASATRSRVLPPSCFSVTCVSGLCALEQAAADLAFERVDSALVGGIDTLTRHMCSGFRALGALSASGHLRPFDVEHDGIVIGEAAAFYLVAPLREARETPARACVVSQRLVSDAHHLTSPDPDGKGMALAISGALQDAGLEPSEIGCITVTACGSPVYDRMQSRAIHAALGDRYAEEVPVTTWEPAVGHVLAATGPLGVISAVSSITQRRILPAFQVSRIDPGCQLRYVLDGSLPLRSPCILALTVGFGGQNGATVVTSVELARSLLERSRKDAT